MKKKYKILNKFEHGFSLIEILVVLMIIGLLTSLVAVNVMPSQERARIEKAKADIVILENALEMYKLEKYTYPSEDQGLSFLVSSSQDKTNNSSRRYIKRLPDDPWGNPYQYNIPGENGDYDLFSLGADGDIGGEGDNSDIGNW
ncbi:MAG: type II secretion system major pseudopilin GspG [SAR86 cluster bacterium]|jgi:general secretion pathway protein G|nr:type II secretion system major pseudopilin GspG [SAR86 cluster bacterium]